MSNTAGTDIPYCNETC